MDKTKRIQGHKTLHQSNMPSVLRYRDLLIMLAMISHAFKALKWALASYVGWTFMDYFIFVHSCRQLYGVTQSTQKIIDLVWIMDGSALKCMEMLLKYKYFRLGLSAELIPQTDVKATLLRWIDLGWLTWDDGVLVTSLTSNFNKLYMKYPNCWQARICWWTSCQGRSTITRPAKSRAMVVFGKAPKRFT